MDFTIKKMEIVLSPEEQDTEALPAPLVRPLVDECLKRLGLALPETHYWDMKFLGHEWTDRKLLRWRVELTQRKYCTFPLPWEPDSVEQPVMPDKIVINGLTLYIQQLDDQVFFSSEKGWEAHWDMSKREWITTQTRFPLPLRHKAEIIRRLNLA